MKRVGESSAPQLSRLAADCISEIYAALLGSGDWQSFLDHLSRTLPNGKTTLFYHDFAAGAGAFSLNSQFEPENTAAYNQYYCAKNPWMAKAAVRPIGLGVRAEQMFPREQLRRTEFYADFLRPQGLESGVGVTILRDHGRNFMLSTVFGSAKEDKAAEIAALLTTLAPHLHQAFSYYRRAGAVASGASIVDAASDALGVAIVAVAFARRICWTNAAGRELLCKGDPIGVDARGRLTASSIELRDAVDAALSLATRGDAASNRVIKLSSHGEQRPPARLTLVVPNMTPFERFFAGPTVLLLVEAATHCSLPAEDDLQHVFALTPSEARLARAIAKGMSVSDIAMEQGISRDTAKTHLKRIFAKLDVHRQAELVRKIHELRSRSV